MSDLAAQPYPSAVGWRELSGYYRNGWTDRVETPVVFRVTAEAVHVVGTVSVGTDPVIARLPVGAAGSDLALAEAGTGAGPCALSMRANGNVHVGLPSWDAVSTCDRVKINATFPRIGGTS